MDIFVDIPDKQNEFKGAHCDPKSAESEPF